MGDDNLENISGLDKNKDLFERIVKVILEIRQNLQFKAGESLDTESLALSVLAEIITNYPGSELSDKEIEELVVNAIFNEIYGYSTSWHMSLDEPSSEGKTLMEKLEDVLFHEQELFEEDREISITNEQAINFILSKEVENILSLFKPKQRESIETFRNSPSNKISINKAFSDTKPYLLDSFFLALKAIRSYLQFLGENSHLLNRQTEGWKVFTEKTAPYFWRELGRSKMSQVKYPTTNPDDSVIKEYITHRINELVVTSQNIRQEEKIAYILRYSNELTLNEISNILGVSISTADIYSKKVTRFIQSIGLDIEDLVVEFLTLWPNERQVFLLSKSLSIEEIASTLNTSVGAIWMVRNRIYQKLGIRLPEIAKSSQVSLNLDLISEPRRQFIPEAGLQIQKNVVEELLAEYLLQTGSRYKKELQTLMISGKRDLVELYFLLQEIPDRELVADVLGYSSITIKHKLTDLKKSLVDQSDPRYVQRDYESWIEVTRLGKMFLLTDEDLRIIGRIKELRNDIPNLSINYLADTMGISSSSLKYRIKRIKELFGITEERLSLLPELIKGREQ